MLYLFQITTYSALLYTVYLLVLKDRESHGWNRLYLLLCAILPLAIPFIKVPAFQGNSPVSPKVINILLPQVTVFSGQHAVAKNTVNWMAILLAVYALVSVSILAWTFIQLISFIRFVRGSKWEMIGNVKVLLNTNAGPGSFQNYIFLPGKEIDAAIFEHELAHIRLKHSSDIILMRILQTVFWPNIILHVILKELKIVHEFQADAYAVKNNESYIITMLNDAFGTKQFALSHTFFFHPLKRRIMMLQKAPLSRRKLRITMFKTGLLSVCVLACIVYLQSCKQPDKPKADDTIFVFKSAPDTTSITTTEERTDLPKPMISKAKIYIIPDKNGHFGLNAKSEAGQNTNTAGPEITVTPNPLPGTFTINGSTGKSADEITTIEVTNLSGQTIYKETVTAPKGVLSKEMKLGNKTTNGMYVVNVHSTSFNQVLHLALMK